MRKTAKALPFIDHRKLGRCVVLSQEKSDKLFGLLGGGIDKRETADQAITRELQEELKNVKIHNKKELFNVQTSQNHTVFAVKLSGKVKLSNELIGLGFYPLEKKYEIERKKLKKIMQKHAQKAIQQFMQKYQIYNFFPSDQLKLGSTVYDNFHKIMKKL